MYGKWFDSVYEGSLAGSGSPVLAVWGYCCCKADPQDHTVLLNPKILSAKIGDPEHVITEAIAKLCAPDAKSTCKEHDGRRLLPVSGYMYSVVTHEHYRNIRNSDDVRAYHRELKRAEREKRAVHDSHGQSLTPASVSVSDSVSPKGDARGADKPVSFKLWTRPDLEAAIAAANHDGMLTATECAEFADYWLEPTPTGRTRLSLERTWETRRRMRTALEMVYAKKRAGGAHPAQRLNNTWIDPNPDMKIRESF